MVQLHFTQANFEYLLLIFARIASFVFVAPFFSMANTPNKLRIGVSVFISILIYQVLPKESLAYSTVLEYAVLVIREVTVGLLIGLSANICTYIITFAGKFIDTEIGLSMVSLFDPISKEEVSITAGFYNYIFMLLLIVSDMHQYILRAVIDSYQLIKIGSMLFHSNHLYTSFVNFMGDSMVIGFRIVLPVFAVMMVTNVVLAVLAKVAPQMNMFVIGVQIKILMGLMAMFLTIGLFTHVSDFIFTEMKKMIVAVIEGMY